MPATMLAAPLTTSCFSIGWEQRSQRQLRWVGKVVAVVPSGFLAMILVEVVRLPGPPGERWCGKPLSDEFEEDLRCGGLSIA